MKLDIQHRELVDIDVLRARMELVRVIVDALQHDPAWKQAGDIGRRTVAKRIAFSAWRLDDLNGWGAALRNRCEGRS